MWVVLLVACSVIFFSEAINERIADAYVKYVTLPQQHREVLAAQERARVTYPEIIALLGKIPGAARVRVVRVYVNPTTGDARYDVDFAAASAGHEAGPLLSNQPMSLLRDYLVPLLNHECVYVDVASRTNRNEYENYVKTTNIPFVAFAGCPMFVSGKFVGGVFVGWDRLEDVPADLEPIKGYIREVAEQLQPFQVNCRHC
jgi:hypothetical protein